MRTLRRFAALFVAALLVLALAVPALAENSSTITFNNAVEGHTYTAYQIFKGTRATTSASDTSLGDVEWGDGITAAGKTALLGYDKASGVWASAKELSENIGTTDDDAVKFANAVTASNKAYLTNGHTGTLSEGVYTISGLEDGYYVIVDTYDSPTGKVEGKDYTIARYMLQVVGNAVVNNKADKPTLDKVIVEDSTDVKENVKGIGDDVDYKLTSYVPEMTGYVNYFYVINDTMSEGLTFNDDVAITIGTGNDAITLTKATGDNAKKGEGQTFYVVTETDSTTKATKIKIVLNNFIQYKSNVGDAITVTYSATLNEKAKVDSDPNTNTVNLVYSNDPTKDGIGDPDTPHEPKNGTDTPTGQTPDSTTKTYSTTLNLIKVDGENQSQTLTGAKFKVTGNQLNTIAVTNGSIYVPSATGTYYMLKDGTYTTAAPGSVKETRTVGEDTIEIKWDPAAYDSTTQKYALIDNVVKATTSESAAFEVTSYVNASGNLQLKGLTEGTYTIEELVAPTGYNKLTTKIEVKIEAEYNTNGTFKAWKVTQKNQGASGDGTTVTYNTAAKQYEIKVENNKGTGLPTTGGVGTKLFYALGAILMVGAAVLMVTKRRVNED